MKKPFFRIIAVCVALCVMLSGCALRNFTGLFDLLGHSPASFDTIRYARPDMTAFAAALDKVCVMSQREANFDTLLDGIWEFYGVYDSFYTNQSLAMIYYCKDVTDAYWQAEYAFCEEKSHVVDAGLDRLYRTLAKSPLREKLEGEDYFGADYFDSYEGESLYDETFTAMLEEESRLVSRYYTVSAEAAETEYYSEEYFSVYGSQMETMFLELVQLRNRQAAYAGYDSYPEFAYDFYHLRDYTPQQATAYLADIRAELVPMYRKLLNASAYDSLQNSTQLQTYSYVKSVAQAMGGTVKKAFDSMTDAKMYDITLSDKKQGTSFVTYLMDYQTPYLFLSPSGTEYDKLTFAHEFGHFCSEYAVTGGSYAGVDVAEIFSQAMEYLSLQYAQDAGNLEKVKMADCLSTYVEQAAYASFEQQVYDLPPEQLTVDGIRALYEQIGISYGFDALTWDSRDYIAVTHFYESPLYIISYVVSNDAAFQIYEKERAQTGAGLQCFEENLATNQLYLLSFLQEAGLTSPFVEGRLTQVRQTLEKVLT